MADKWLRMAKCIDHHEHTIDDRETFMKDDMKHSFREHANALIVQSVHGAAPREIAQGNKKKWGHMRSSASAEDL